MGSLFAVISQCLLGGKMATAWAAKRCLSEGQACDWLVLHRSTATLVAISVLVFVCTALWVEGWSRTQWPMLLASLLLVFAQISIGFLSVNLGLSQPILTVLHQLFAVLLVALLAALSFRKPQIEDSNLNHLVDANLFGVL